MKSINLKKLAVVSALGLVALLGTSEIANAQGRDNYDRYQDRKINKQQDKINKQQDKINRQNAKIEQQRIRAEQQRILAEQKRQAELNRRSTRRGNYRSNGNGYYNGNANSNSNRYRVIRNGTFYNTDQRGADLLRQAVNAGYQQGYEAGRNDRSGRRRSSYSTSNVYRSGNYGYESYVDQNQYQYYFKQGFQRGYQDGYNSRNQYGSNNGGSINILSAILGQILNIRSY